jgi:hypothetical protein
MLKSFFKLADWRGKLARLALAGVVLLGVAPVAIAETDPLGLYASPDGTWKLAVVADAAAKSAGRSDFTEFVTIDGLGYTGQEITRLGFTPVTPSTGTNLLGETTFSVTMDSGSHGQWKASGNFNLLYTTMTGTLLWTKEGVTYKYTFTGVRYTPAASEYES